MPYFSSPTRRRFLGTALASAAAARAASITRWAVLADTHIDADPAVENRGFRIADNLKRVAGEVTDWAPEGVILNGDVARVDGKAADYAHVRTLVEPFRRMPLGMTLGNHDDRGNFQKAFASHPGQSQPVREKHVLVVEHPPVRFILLDSLYQVNVVQGLLGQTQRRWLDQYLGAAAPMPTLVFVHHTLDDADSSMLDADRFLRILSGHQMVKAVFFGHSHVYNITSFEGMHLVNHPAVGYNFADSQPVGWIEAGFHAEGAELKLRAIGGNMAGDGETRSLAWR